MAKPLNISEEEEFEFRLRLEREQEAAQRQGGEKESDAPIKYGGILPRTSAFEEKYGIGTPQESWGRTGKRALATGLDLLSLPGRAVSAAGSFAGGLAGGSLDVAKKEFQRELGRTEADPEQGNVVTRFAENMLRDPATLATLPIGGIGGAVGKTAIKRVGGAALRGLGEGALSAAVHQSENLAKDDNINWGEAAIETGLSGALTGGGQILGEATSGAKRYASEMMQSIIKPRQKNIFDGFKAETIEKFGLVGPVDDVAKQGQEMINQRVKQAKALLKQSDENGGIIDAGDLWFNTIKKLQKNLGENFGDNIAIEQQIVNLRKELDKVSPDGFLDILDAQAVKQGAGKKGAWATLHGKTTGDPDASATEKVYTTFYHELKNAIEKNTPKGLKEVNKEISELIPVVNAADYRATQGKNNYKLGLYEIIAGTGLIAGGLGLTDDPKSKGGLAGLGMLGIAAGVKSPHVAKQIYNVGKQFDRPAVKAATNVAGQLGGLGRAGLRANIFGNENE